MCIYIYIYMCVCVCVVISLSKSVPAMGSTLPDLVGKFWNRLSCRKRQHKARRSLLGKPLWLIRLCSVASGPRVPLKTSDNPSSEALAQNG